MSKELTPLESFENIKSLFVGSPINLSQQFDTIEKTLEEKEQQDNLIKIIKETIEFGIKDHKVKVSKEGHVSMTGTIGIILKKELDKKEKILFRNWILETCFPKELKALKIIRTKKVNVNCIISGWSLAKYNSYKSHIKLTKEEYDTLRRTLL